MIRTILVFTVFWLFMVFSLLFFIPYIPLSLPGLGKAQERYVLGITRFWAKFVIFITGSKVEVKGLENLPEDRHICFVANHQSYFDIPVVMASIPRIVGFMAKKELKSVPLLSNWMKTIGCIFMDRKNPREAIKKFEEGAEEIRQGKAKLIFPEGTRSRGGEMGPIRAGALKLAFRADAVIVPMTIDGSYRIFEEHHRVASGRVVLTIHPPISAGGLSREQQKETAETVEKRIASPLNGESAPLNGE
ncbi:MAG: lysophospholipid acyltransferase family protein [Spirochaetaceae bacterium]